MSLGNKYKNLTIEKSNGKCSDSSFLQKIDSNIIEKIKNNFIIFSFLLDTDVFGGKN